MYIDLLGFSSPVWTAKHVAAIAVSPVPSAPVISLDDRQVIIQGLDL